MSYKMKYIYIFNNYIKKQLLKINTNNNYGYILFKFSL